MLSPLRWRRKESGLLLEDIAKTIEGASVPYLSKLERGLVEKIDRRQADRIARAYAANLEEIDLTVYSGPAEWQAYIEAQESQRKEAEV